jgi:hypothetical protein
MGGMASAACNACLKVLDPNGCAIETAACAADH